MIDSGTAVCRKIVDWLGTAGLAIVSKLEQYPGKLCREMSYWGMLKVVGLRTASGCSGTRRTTWLLLILLRWPVSRNALPARSSELEAVI